MMSSLETIVALAKRRGFIYQGGEIYGGLAGTWDYGPLGAALKKNIENLWWHLFVVRREDIFGLDSAIITKAAVLQAAGHADGFSDPLVECEKCKHRFRLDQLIDKTKCPDCSGALGEEKQFNMMFQTKIGSNPDDSSDLAYLRPETAQGTFINFKNIIDSFHPKLPFGIAQIGKAFRNEIAPRDFLFRSREFTQMEIEYFVLPQEWEKFFEYWQKELMRWIEIIGLSPDSIHRIEVSAGDRAHYSSRTIDIEFDFPFGRKELYGLAYRSDFDLKNHSQSCGTELFYFDEDTKQKFIPHVIEPTFGVDRTVLALLLAAYSEDDLGGEKRVVLRLAPFLAPISIAVFPLLKNKPQLAVKAREIYNQLKLFLRVVWDDNGNIGKRYRRQDEIGTPFCVTIDFVTLEDNTVTVRERDSGEQKRLPVADLVEYFIQALRAPGFEPGAGRV